MSTSSSDAAATDPNRTTRFLRLLGECDQQLTAYILALVLSVEDADEIAQTTKIKLWEQFDRFESGTDFAAWARTVAYYEVLNFRQRKQTRREHLPGDKFMEAVAAQAEQAAGNERGRRIALDRCLGKLDAAVREFVLRCYTAGVQIGEVAAEMGRPVTAVYQKLWRVRKQLHECVDRELNREGQP